MKNFLIVSVIFLSSIVGFSQNEKMPNGTYSAFNSDKILNLLIQDGKMYLYALPFDYTIYKDSLLSIKENQKPSGFSLLCSYDSSLEANKIRLNLSYDLVTLNKIFVGTGPENSSLNFISLSKMREESVSNGYSITTTEDMFLDIDKTQNITLVREDTYENSAEITKFVIPKDVNTIKVNYTEKSEFTNITGIYNQKTKDITLYNDGKDPLKFKFSKEFKQTDFVIPIETTNEKNWTFTGKDPSYFYERTKIANEIEKIANDSANKYTIKESTNVFSHFRAKNFKEALNNVSKYKKKFLVVSIDLKNKNRNTEYDTFIKNSESSLFGTYEDNEISNKFDYYLATEKDKNLLSKYKIKSDSEILVFNSTGDLIYHTPESLSYNSKLFGTYDSAYEELKKANQQLEFDKVMLNKKASNKEILSILNKVHQFDFQIIVTEVPAIDISKFESIPIVEKTITTEDATRQAAELNDDEIEKTITDEEQKTLSETIPPPQIIDSTEAVYPFSSEYTIIKDQKNLYQLKSTLEIVNDKWQKIINEFQKSKKTDTDFVYVLKKELNDEGFSKKIFGISSVKIIDFKMLNYIFENFEVLTKKIIRQANATNTNETAIEKATDEPQKAVDYALDIALDEEQYTVTIEATLDNYFSGVAYEHYDEKDKTVKRLIFDYYRKYLELMKYKPSVVKKYLNFLYDDLKNETIRKEYFMVFETYFNKIMAPNKSIIENLDFDYSLDYASENQFNYDNNWIVYKNKFAEYCNTVSWEIVKIGTNKNLIQKAIKWSETSVIIEKDSHYFWDTLARLYYLNGQKEKAIATQQKAIDLGGDSENSDDYRNTLQEMKNGIYTLPKIE